MASSMNLSEMTPEQRAECVGMWCSYEGRNVILTAIGRLSIHFLVPATGETGSEWNELAYMFNPRGNLPRAWAPDGTPPKGDWQQADYEHHHTHGLYSVEATELGPSLTPTTTHAKRWVGEWKQA